MGSDAEVPATALLDALLEQRLGRVVLGLAQPPEGHNDELMAAPARGIPHTAPNSGTVGGAGAPLAPASRVLWKGP